MTFKLKNIGAISITIIVIACAKYEKAEKPAYTLNETIYVDRLPNDNYKLILEQKGTWKVYKGYDQNNIDWNTPHELTTDKKEITIENEQPNKRMFFGAIKAKDTLFLSEREIDMENTVNFRDLGGIPTTDGKHTKWGMLYRSGDLPEITDNDMDYIQELGIKTILDLRSQGEIDEKPDMYPQETQWVHLPIGNMENQDTKEMLKKLKEADPETFDGDKMMKEFSIQFVNNPDNFKKLFQYILNTKDVPLLFHCTAGKDRTGFSSAFILYALGVDEETILNEYALSNFFRYEYNESMTQKATTFYGIDQRILRALMGVKKSYLETGFNEIRAKYGSVDNYLSKELGVDSLAKVKLRHIYLQ